MLYLRSRHVDGVSPGDDGLYHWKMLLYNPGTTRSGRVYDTVWSDSKEVGMRARAKDYDPSRDQGVIKVHHLANVLATPANVERIETAVRKVYTPKYVLEDMDKNCQTWLEDVVKRLVKEQVVSSSALSALSVVPKHQEFSQNLRRLLRSPETA